MNEPARLFGVFYEPGKVFADVAERPRWIAPMIVSILFAMAFTYAISSHIGWEQTIRQTLANNPRAADLPADQRELAVTRGAKFASIAGWVGAVAGPPFFTLVVAGILTGIFNGLLGTELKFIQMFSITAYAFLVRGLYTMLLILILYLKPPEDFNIQISPFSPAAYMNAKESPKWLMSLAGSLDLFTLWTIVLLAIGFSVAARKLSFSKALTTVAIPWLILVVGLMCLQAFQ
jgi:Yip1-like protein